MNHMDVFFKKYFPMVCELFYVKSIIVFKMFFRGGCLTPRRFSFFFIIIFNLFFTAISLLFEWCHLSAPSPIAHFVYRNACFSPHIRTSVNKYTKYDYIFSHSLYHFVKKFKVSIVKKIRGIHHTYYLLIEKHIIISIINLVEVHTISKI
jgi:hypothetical protein